MKKFLFVINNMEIGGTRSSLINLLHLLSEREVKIDLLLLSPHGEYMEQIDKKVRILDTPYICETIYTKNDSLSEIRKMLGYVLSTAQRIIGRGTMARIVANKINRKIDRNYDAVFGFQEGDTVNVAAYIMGKKHYCWIHNNATDIGNDGLGTKEAFYQMQEVFFVSKTAEKNFIDFMKGYSGKTRVIKNTVNIETIEKGALLAVNDLPNSYKVDIKIVSVGRFTEQKAFYRIIPMAKKLKENNISFAWIVVGDGPERQDFMKLVKENNLDDQVFSLGNKSNPYPYMRWADLLAVTSKYESQPMVILEALILQKPVLATNFPSAYELLGGKKYAYICNNSDNGTVEGVKEVIIQGLIRKMALESQIFQYDNKSIIDEIIRL